MPTDYHAATNRLFFVVLSICRRVRFAVKATPHLHGPKASSVAAKMLDVGLGMDMPLNRAL